MEIIFTDKEGNGTLVLKATENGDLAKLYSLLDFVKNIKPSPKIEIHNHASAPAPVIDNPRRRPKDSAAALDVIMARVEKLSRHSISEPQRRVLEYIIEETMAKWDNFPVTVQTSSVEELNERLALAPTTLNHAVRCLEDAGIVHRLHTQPVRIELTWPPEDWKNVPVNPKRHFTRREGGRK